MKRYPIEKMKEWLALPGRKPLILRGARQVGKTWLVRTLAKETHKNLIEINFEKQRKLAIHFESNDPKNILLNLKQTF